MILKNCKKHGDLTANDLIKKGKLASGNQAYRCKKCMKELHSKNYANKKEIILKKIKEYKELNKERVKSWKKAYAKKHLERDRDKKRARDHKLYLKSKKGLEDRYIKHLICKRSMLRYQDIPKSFIEFKRILLQVKKTIKEHKIALIENKLK